MYLIALHSFFVGIGLLCIKAEWMSYFGFEIHYHNFFRAQGGVFHFVMVVIYIMAARIPENTSLLLISITAKFIAAVFLLAYYFSITSIWSVLFSGIGDGLMGFIMLMFLLKFNKYQTKRQ